ncbi:hypothetical protein JOF41_003469 [Saccharothrix coeruleofusca]|uniref:hypothetical protein n=1 Tax=Saccharothrix coeruleofusca TaxID=33919 RepID=UPI001AE91DF2|nr:hypothetical protein [Saccharothrix coeruleofusca]MBP2337291.1 hypothetical protein [Saccharothrix coeruleofusca]
MDLAATFAAIPGAVPIDGVPDAWFWTHAPKFGHSAVLSRDGKHAFQCYAHNSYDEGLARAVITFTREHDAELIAPPQRPLVVVEGFEHPGFGFDTVVAVSPDIHKYQSDKPEVHEVTRAVFPAYRCEFSGAETEDDAAYRYTRAAGAQPSRWDREPNPYLKMRHRAASGREIPERGFANPSRVVHEFAALPEREDGFVEFENFERRVWRVTFQNTHYTAIEEGPENAAAERMDFDDLVEFTKRVLYGPNRTSGESAIDKS